MNKIEKIVNKIRRKCNIQSVETAIVVGSGLFSSVPELDSCVEISYRELGMPTSKVKGHSGKFVFGKINDQNVVIVSRLHYYESGDIAKERLPYEVIKMLGVKRAVIMTSCGGLNKSFKVGDIMIISDHINMSGVVPTVGMDEISFTDMGDCYHSKYISEVREIAKQENIDLREGVHVQTSGPNYETKAEVEMFRKMGGDTVSMSTAHDCIIANHFGIKVLGFAVVVNVFSDQPAELTHEEVLENAQKACEKIKKILINFI